MASLIDDLEKSDDQQALIDIFDTFKRPFTVYIEAQKVIITTNPAFSRFGQNDQNSLTVPVQPQPITMYGVILYDKKQYYPFMVAGETQLKVKMTDGDARIKVSVDDAQTLRVGKQFQIDGFDFTIDTAPRPHGLFIPSLYTFYLKRVQ